MNIFQKAARAFGSIFKTYVEPGWQPLLELVESEEHFKHRPLTANEQVSWVYACIRRISMSVMSAYLRLYQTNTEGQWKEVDSHEILDLLPIEKRVFLSSGAVPRVNGRIELVEDKGRVRKASRAVSFEPIEDGA